jgi:anti-anti-sigma factor
MVISNEKSEGRIKIKIEGAISIHKAQDLREMLLTHLYDDSKLELNLEKVSDCDTAGLQVLLSAKKTADKENLSYRVTGVPEVVMDILQNAGINPDDMV